MPQSLAAIYLHIVFSTHTRAPSITDEHREELHRYLGGIAHQRGCQPLGIGGTADHVHVLLSLPRTITVAKLLQDLMSYSSAWMKPRFRSFAWQAGYAVFSFAEPDLRRLQEYVANQEDHHKKVSFQDELRSMLSEHSVEYDERHLWD